MNTLNAVLSLENVLIAGAFLYVAFLIGSSLWRGPTRTTNMLGWATCGIFLTCAFGHFMHGVLYILSLQARGDTALASYGDYALYVCSAIGVDNPTIANFLQTLADSSTVVAALLFLSLRKRYGLLSNAEGVVFDYERKVRQYQERETELRSYSADLEDLVAERTSDLQDALLHAQARTEEQARLLEENEAQRKMIHELSVPVLPITSDTLVMPLVGALDNTRLSLIQERALQAVERTAARYLLLDITGVPQVDAQIAQGLLAVVQAARLMGTETVLVGIRPEVAQAIVHTGIQLGSIATVSNLQAALTRYVKLV